MMLSWMIVLLMMVVLFKGVGLMFRIAGRVLGGMLGIIGWLILARIAIAVLGIALYAVPLFLIAGSASLISGGRQL